MSEVKVQEALEQLKKTIDYEGRYAGDSHPLANGIASVTFAMARLLIAFVEDQP